MTLEEFKTWCIEKDLPSFDMSVSWSAGGTWGNCWDDTVGHISAEPPKELVQFDELLQGVKPEITFLQYKTMYNSLVQETEDCQGDYYGGREYYVGLKINFDKVYEYLKDKGWLPE